MDHLEEMRKEAMKNFFFFLTNQRLLKKCFKGYPDGGLFIFLNQIKWSQMKETYFFLKKKKGMVLQVVGQNKSFEDEKVSQ